MKFLQELLREAEENPEETIPPEATDDADDEQIEDDGDNDIGSVAEKQGYQKAKTEMEFAGQERTVTTLTKDEELGGLKLHTMYIINPKTGSWVYKAGLVGEDDSHMSEFRTGEDPSSLLKHLKKKRKISPHQAVEYLNPPTEKESSEVTESMKQYTRKSEWEAEAKRRGYEIEADGSNKFIAHEDGDEKGTWDPKYGGAGHGWFNE